LYYRYHREHPEAARKDKDSEFEEWFESDNQRELRQIFTGQSQMFELMRELNRKLDEVVGRQERTLSLLSSVQAGTVPSAGMSQQFSYFTNYGPYVPL
jgi:mannose-binding lectin 1